MFSAMIGHDILLVSFDLPDYDINSGDRFTSNAFMGFTHFLSNAHASGHEHIMEEEYLPQGIGSVPTPIGQGFLTGLESAEGNIGGMRFDFLNLTSDNGDPKITETEIDPDPKGIRQAVSDFRGCLHVSGISLVP